jgi:hypothetical protein
MNLIDIGLNVDTSDLDSALDDIRSQIADIVSEQDDRLDEDRVREIVFEHAPSEERVQEIVRDMLSDEGMDEDRVQDIVRDLVHSEGSDFVQNEVSGMGFVTEDYVRNLIEDERVSGLDEDDVERIVLEKLEDVPDSQALTDLERRFEMYATRVDDLMQANRSLNERVELQHRRIAELETTLASRPAVQGLSLFELLSQAARILGIAR